MLVPQKIFPVVMTTVQPSNRFWLFLSSICVQLLALEIARSFAAFTQAVSSLIVSSQGKLAHVPEVSLVYIIDGGADGGGGDGSSDHGSVADNSDIIDSVISARTGASCRLFA